MLVPRVIMLFGCAPSAVHRRYAQREENRKDVLRTLLALVEEAQRADELAAAAGEGGSPPPPSASDPEADAPAQAVGSG